MTTTDLVRDIGAKSDVRYTDFSTNIMSVCCNLAKNTRKTGRISLWTPLRGYVAMKADRILDRLFLIRPGERWVGLFGQQSGKHGGGL